MDTVQAATRTKVNFQVKLPDIPLQIIKRYERLGERVRVSRPELLVNLQAVEADDKGVRDYQEHIVPFKPSWICNAGFKQGGSHRKCERVLQDIRT